MSFIAKRQGTQATIGSKCLLPITPLFLAFFFQVKIVWNLFSKLVFASLIFHHLLFRRKILCYLHSMSYVQVQLWCHKHSKQSKNCIIYSCCLVVFALFFLVRLSKISHSYASPSAGCIVCIKMTHKQISKWKFAVTSIFPYAIFF